MDTTMNTDKARKAPQSIAHSAIDKTAAGVHQAVDKVVDVVAPAAGWIESNAKKMNKSRIRAIEGGKKCIQNYPFATIGAAIAIGALISVFARGRPE